MKQRDERGEMPQEIAMYDSEEHWHLGLEAAAWSVDDIGESMDNRTLYL